MTSPLVNPDGSHVRILHIGKFYPPHKGGMETHLQTLCRSLAPYADVEAIVASESRRSVRENDYGVRVNRIGTLANVASAAICPGLVRAIRETPADVVHIHLPNPTAVAALFASGHPGRLVVTYHSDIIRQQLLKIALQPLHRWLLDRAEAIICFSPNYVESSPVLEHWRDKCHVIPHGIDLRAFERADEDEVAEIRSRFGKRIVLGVGRLVYYKGFEYLIRALWGTDATLLLIGTGPLLQNLQRTARNSGVAERVHFLGEVPDVTPYYRAARVFALPSIARSEAFGIVQLEAMTCGTPVINTRLDSGVPFVSLNGESGLTVPPRDVASLHEAITCLVADDFLHKRLSQGAKERVRHLFTREKMTADTLDVYRQVLNQDEESRENLAAVSTGAR